MKIEKMTPEQLIKEFNAGHANIDQALYHLILFTKDKPELKDLHTWATKERNGYSDGDTIPTYRVMPVEWYSKSYPFDHTLHLGSPDFPPEGFESQADYIECLREIYDPWPVRDGVKRIRFDHLWDCQIAPPTRMEQQISHGKPQELYKIARGIVSTATEALSELLPPKEPLSDLPQENKDKLTRILEYLEYFHYGADLLKERKKKGNEKDVHSYPITNEYAIQDLLLASLRPWVWDLKSEFCGEPQGDHTPRYDLYSPSLNMVIELKFCTKATRDRTLESCRGKMPTYIKDQRVAVLIYYIWNAISDGERAIEDYYDIQHAFNNDGEINSKPFKTIMVISHQNYPKAKRP